MPRVGQPIVRKPKNIRFYNDPIDLTGFRLYVSECGDYMIADYLSHFRTFSMQDKDIGLSSFNGWYRFDEVQYDTFEEALEGIKRK